jgi:MoaA/NifB/PqqE/SkfB family radical SAM enzyme/protein-L-isoaspartate O-methyltransferase
MNPVVTFRVCVTKRPCKAGSAIMRGDGFFVQVSRKPPFTKLHPRVAGFFKEYFAKEKAVRFGDRFVVNTHFPPYPSRAFDQLADGFRSLGDAGQRRLYSVTLAVTNRCAYRCWHCYNAGRSQADLPLEVWRRLAPELQDLGAVMVTLTGGEPLLRGDLEEIVGLFDDRSCLVLGTTGAGLSAQRAWALRQRGLFAVGISLDSADEAVHDRLRGQQGAFQTALRAVAVARENDLYGYVVAVATREFLEPAHFRRFMRFAGDIGALEVHLLEPGATGNLAGRTDVLLTEPERRQILAYQNQVAEDETLPILSSYAYLEGADAFGCGAGLTHLYMDGSGEVSPCQLVPLSFGNAAEQPLSQILGQMGLHFRTPRTDCVGRVLAGRLPEGCRPLPPGTSAEVCRQCLPFEHPLPRFFAVHRDAREEVGRDELQAAYDRIHDDYDGFWLTEAAGPIDRLVGQLADRPYASAFEAGCGTGYATAQLAGLARAVLAVDISEGMLSEARRRLRTRGIENVRWEVGDALEVLDRSGPFDLVFTSWVLGYIPLAPFFTAVGRRLSLGGRLAFVVHRENSPREPLEIFAELVARDPSVLQKRVAFDFPRDKSHVESEMGAAGLEVEDIREDAIVFRYRNAEEVIEHLLKSGAGTAFHDAVAADRREDLAREFLDLFAARHRLPTGYEVRHEYVACIARKR